jgi:predicted nucleic acid-binding protein
MSAYFFDSSAIVKRYVKEAGTERIIKITDPTKRSRIYVARITGVEVVSAITRRGRNDDISGIEMKRAITQFQNDFSSQYRVVEITSSLVVEAMSLAQIHALRGYDAVQLAATLEINDHRLGMALPALTLVSADDALNEAARAERLAVYNPNARYLT